MPAPTNRHRLFDALLTSPAAAPTDIGALAQLQAQYFGMISEVDAQLARIWAALRQRADWLNTVIVVTADHVCHGTVSHGPLPAGHPGASGTSTDRSARARDAGVETRT